MGVLEEDILKLGFVFLRRRPGCLFLSLNTNKRAVYKSMVYKQQSEL